MKRDKLIQVKVNEEEKKKIEEQADKKGLRAPSYLRNLALEDIEETNKED